jgi:hypothetical protein
VYDGKLLVVTCQHGEFREARSRVLAGYRKIQVAAVQIAYCKSDECTDVATVWG